MTGCEPVFSPLLIGLWFSAVAALTWQRQRAFRDVLRRSYCWSLSATTLGSALLLCLLLLQPYREVSRPDREGFRVVVLADLSRSMAVRDLPGETRRDAVLRQSLASSDAASLLSRLQEHYRVEPRGFSDTVRPLPGVLLRGTDAAADVLLPGRTALGEALKQTLDEAAGAPLGAILLLSDGRSNQGLAPAEAAKVCRSRDVPVSCIGIGSREPPGDLSVSLQQTFPRVVKGEPFNLVATLENRFPQDVEAVAELRDEADVLLAVAALTVPAEGTAEARFEVTPLRAGYTAWTVALQPLPGDQRRDNDSDVTAVEVSEADRFRLLYLGGHLSWEFRFLRMLAESTSQLDLAAVIRSGKETFYRSGFSPEAEAAAGAGFPRSAALFHHFDAILLDTRSVPLLGEEGVAALQGFVEHRGGGLLCFGPLEGLPAPLLEILPVRQADPQALVREGRLDINTGFIFDRDPAAILRSTRSVPLPAGGPVWFALETKPGARSAATLAGSPRTALAAQRYGSGRIAYLGFENSWRWRLQDRRGEDTHSAFWNALLVWLGSTGKQRLTAAAAAARGAVGEPMPLDVAVLGTDFQPAPDARVSAAVTAPDGTTHELPLDPAADIPGRYTGLYLPRDSGRHRVSYRVQLPNERFSEQVFFLARQTGVEAEDTTYAEDVLRDVARITGGDFWEHDALSRITTLPLSSRVPVNSERLYWARSWPMLTLLAALLCSHWLLRRRVGLR